MAQLQHIFFLTAVGLLVAALAGREGCKLLIKVLVVQIPAFTVYISEVSLGKTLNPGSSVNGGMRPLVYGCVRSRVNERPL